jgi:antitoxin component YwqK of YwqJK toxin-antitoxin module
MQMKTLSFFLALFLSLFFMTGCSSSSLPNPFGAKVKKEYFTGGKLRSEFIMEKGSEQNGVLKKYGYDGRITSVAHIKNGVNDGMETWYDKKGRILMKVPYVNGKKDGIQKAFYPNGDVMVATTYQNGIKHGKAVAYNKDGSIHRQAMFQRGNILN